MDPLEDEFHGYGLPAFTSHMWADSDRFAVHPGELFRTDWIGVEVELRFIFAFFDLCICAFYLSPPRLREFFYVAFRSTWTDLSSMDPMGLLCYARSSRESSFYFCVSPRGDSCPDVMVARDSLPAVPFFGAVVYVDHEAMDALQTCPTLDHMLSHVMKQRQGRIFFRQKSS